MKYKIIFLFLLLLKVNMLFSSEIEQVRKAPCVNATLWQAFALSDVKLTDSRFKYAMDLHKTYLLSLEVDRLIPHIRRNVGLEGKGENYGGWEKGGGCTYGHYMSACAMMYAATGESELFDKLEYIVSELKVCQSHTEDGWFISRQRSKDGYKQLLDGMVLLNKPDETKQPWNYNQNGNSWYCIHKILAGLRDAYVYGGLESAKEVLIPLADFITNIALNANSDLFQSTLSVEQGGMNEVFADIYSITGDRKYLDTAERFNHINVIYPVANGEDVLFGRHANDQIPKFIGVAREYEFIPNELYHKAAQNFWQIIINDHTNAIGGNSCYERFGIPGEESKRLDYSSSETCNTYNMLKLTRQLFMLDGGYDYLNYYEHALYNHILASQDPDMPGCVTYYTSLLPGLIKQYSTPFDSFWCCVGTGMENHAKYAESIYFKGEQELLVNLFIPSVLNWKEKNLQLTLDTNFPESEIVNLRINQIGDYKGAFLIRYPDWVQGDATILVNGKIADVETKKGEYIRLLSSLTSGDVITLTFPRKLHIRYTKDEPHFGSLMYGPILLAGDLGTETMPVDRVSDNRALKNELPAKDIPMLVGSTVNLENWIVKDADNALTFTVKNGNGQRNVNLLPYFNMHHKRHTVYWKIYSPDEFAYRQQSLTDEINIGEPANEKTHNLKGENDSIYWHDYFWARNSQYRMANDGGCFSYDLKINKKETKPYYLICRWWGDESETHQFDLYVDDKLLQTVNLNRKLYLTYVDDIYAIPTEWTSGKNKITVRFQSLSNKKAGGLYSLKITSDTNFR